MPLAIAQTPFWIVALPVAGALFGVVLGQLAPELFRRRAVAEARYDAAISAVGKVFAARHGVGLHIPAEWMRSTDASQHVAIESDLSRSAVERYLNASAEARAALAALYPWSPDLRRFWDRPFISEEQFEELVSILSERRQKPEARN